MISRFHDITILLGGCELELEFKVAIEKNRRVRAYSDNQSITDTQSQIRNVHCDTVRFSPLVIVLETDLIEVSWSDEMTEFTGSEGGCLIGSDEEIGAI